MNAFTQDGHTPVYLASLKGHVDVVRLLIQNKCNLSLCTKVL